MTRSAHSLYFLEQLLGDECGVLTRILDTLELHESEVVPIAEDAIDVGHGDRPAGTIRALKRHDALLVQFVAQHRRCPLTSGVFLIQPGHPGSALWIERNGLDLSTIRHPFT
nr:hypothetical protein [Aeromicrobium sp. Root344]